MVRRVAKLRAIEVLGEARGGERISGHYVPAHLSMLGPQFGETVIKPLYAHVDASARPKMSQIAHNDAFFSLFTATGNSGIKLEPSALIRRGGMLGLLPDRYGGGPAQQQPANGAAPAAAGYAAPAPVAAAAPPPPPKPALPAPPRPPGQEALCAMAEQLLPKSASNRVLKAQAVRVLTGLADAELKEVLQDGQPALAWVFERKCVSCSRLLRAGAAVAAPALHASAWGCVADDGCGACVCVRAAGPSWARR